MARYFVIFKPYGMLSQFTKEGDYKTLGDLYNFPKNVYPVGRLDADSEGLLILTNDKKINTLLLHPNRKHKRVYLVQVEGNITKDALKKLKRGVEITVNHKKYNTMEALAERTTKNKNIAERDVPIKTSKPNSWIKLTLFEGKNRQVRKMTAAVGFPTLRLIRVEIEDIQLYNMKPGDVQEMNAEMIYRKLKLKDM